MDDAMNGLTAAYAAAEGTVARNERRERPLLVCFSHLRWDFVWQRPQHLLSRAVRAFDVIFVEEPVFRAVRSARLETKRAAGGVRVALPVLPNGTSPAAAIDMQRALIERLLDAEDADTRLFWYYTPMAMSFTAGFASDLTVYDNMDELSAFRGASAEMLAREEELFARADLVFTGGLSLYEAKRGRHDDLHAFPSSIEASHFAAARSPCPEPADQVSIPHPRIGFFGVIDERMDVELVRRVAELRPYFQLVMIGPVVKIDPADLPRQPNIHWLGPKAYADLPAYLAGWDAGFMPFALNEATRFISPTKTPEYLAAGLPLVSTAITDVVRPYGEKGFVAIARSAKEMAEQLDAALDSPQPGWLDRVDSFLAEGSWDLTWAAMRHLMEDRLGRRRGALLQAAAAATLQAS